MLDDNFPIYILAFALTFILTVLTERILIPLLQKKASQPIYEDGPKWHMSKSGTPTMGGLAFLLAINITLLLGIIFLISVKSSDEAINLGLCLGYASLNAVIGIIDDSKKLKRKNNAGLSPKEKMIFQAIIAVAFLLLRGLLIENATVLSFSFGRIDLGILYYPLAMLILLGITNCANLTDGVDGLASGVAFAVGVVSFYISCALSDEVAIISSAIMGATSGFLIFNLHPAKIFMGDTGSLFLGALVASTGFALGNPLIVIFTGAVYVIEGISVILQVSCFKLTGKRLFKMSPLHHHLEKSGWSENRICIVAILLTFIISIPAFVCYLP